MESIRFTKTDLYTLSTLSEFIDGVRHMGDQLADGKIDGCVLAWIAAPSAHVASDFLDEMDGRFRAANEAPAAAPDPNPEPTIAEKLAYLEENGSEYFDVLQGMISVAWRKSDGQKEGAE